MEYKVVPLAPSFDVKTSSSKDASDYLERFINHYGNQGWNYVRIENVSTYVSGDDGCFGIGATSGHTSIKQMVVFNR